VSPIMTPIQANPVIYLPVIVRSFHYSDMSRGDWFMVGIVIGGTIAISVICWKLLTRYISNDLARSRVEHVSKFRKYRFPFLVDLLSKCGIGFGKLFLKIKLLFQKSFLKSVCENGCKNCAHYNPGKCADQIRKEIIHE